MRMVKNFGSNMEKEHRRGQMELNTKESGLKVRCTVKVPFYMPIKTCMWVTLLMIKQMEKELIPKKMERSMRATGLTIDPMERENRKSLMVLFTKVNLRMVKNTVMESINGLIILIILANGNITSSMEMELIFGPMVGSMSDSGSTT